MTVLFALAVLELIGFALVRSHPEIREIFKGEPAREQIYANLALLGLWPLLAIALCFESGASGGA